MEDKELFKIAFNMREAVNELIGEHYPKLSAVLINEYEEKNPDDKDSYTKYVSWIPEACSKESTHALCSYAKMVYIGVILDGAMEKLIDRITEGETRGTDG